MLLYAGRSGARLWTAVTIGACAAIVVSNVIYFQNGATPRFLLEKGVLARTSWWLAAFYFHIVGASVCLVSGTPLMFPRWTRHHPAWHRFLGYVYLNAVLWMAAPSGLVLALTAKGGLLGTSGFMLAGVLWWRSTWFGYRAIRGGKIKAHIRAMVRSYCWALSAPAFRAIQAALFLLGLEDSPNYIASLWLSIAASVWLAESYLNRDQRSQFTFARSPSTGAIS